MLDYRAHKLYWLLSRPILLLMYFLVLATIIGACFVGFHFSSLTLVQLAIGFLALQIISVFLALIGLAIDWIFNRLFFFLIDLVPADGRSLEQAKLVLKGGTYAVVLLKPLSTWDDTDVAAVVRSSGIFGRVFFADRIRNRIRYLMQRNQEWLENPDGNGRDLTEYDAKRLLSEAGMNPRWYELALAKGYWRTALLNQILFLITFVALKKGGY